MKLYLVRHGETDWNVEKRAQGSMDIPLNQHGIEQARTLARKIQDQGIKFEAIYSSPLERSYHTAQIIANGAEVILDERLNERNLGELEGKIIPDWRDLGVDLFDLETNSDAFGVEPIRAFQERTAALLQDLQNRHTADACIVLVGSRGTLKRLTMLTTGIEYGEAPKFENAGLYPIEI